MATGKPANPARRKLLQGVAYGFGGLQLGRLGTALREVHAGTKPATELRVPTRPFGKTGVSVAQLSLGGMFDTASNQLLLNQALKWGVSYWDTADCYGGGRSEQGIGKFFKKHPDRRKQVFLVSKSCARDPEEMTRLLDRSLERLHSDFIDLYFLHGVRSPSELTGDLAKWAKRAKAAGKIKLFGFSTHRNMEDCMMAAARLDWIDGIMMSYNYRLMRRPGMRQAMAACSEAGKGLTAMKTQGGGPIKQDSVLEMELAGRFLEKGYTDKQAKLVAVWQEPHIASICSQMPNLTILSANVAAALNRTSLGARDLDLLQRYVEETQSSYCAGCGDLCESALDEEIPVCDIMRYMMYYRNYADPGEARGLFAALPERIRRRLAVADYSKGEKRCPNGLPIARVIRDACSVLS